VIEGAPGTAFEDECVVRRVRWASAESGFAIVEVEREGDEVVLVGTLSHLEQRERVRVTGTWEDDRRYGMQVKVATVESLPPRGDAALIAYLKRVKHVGVGRAARLVRHHGEHTLEVVDRDPHQAFRVVGISSPKRLEEATRSWHSLRSTRALHLLLAPHGLAWLVPRIAERYGEAAHHVVAERPYELTSVFGVGFHTADTIARAGTYRADSPARTRAGVIHVLSEAEADGSTCLPAAELAEKAQELLGTAPTASLLREMDEAGEVVIDAEPEGTLWVYRTPTAMLEAELADRVAELVAAGPADELEPPEAPEDADLVPGPEQWEAVRRAFTSRLSVVTGGPGTGKTATIRLICAAAEAQEADVLLVAPTGRAARRMAESTGATASTIHSALGWVPGEGPSRDEERPLEADVLVVDETSMANLELLVTLLRAVGERTHVVLVGDADQLAPVGAGKPFAELVEAEGVPATRLTHIFRQAAGSMIVRGAHAVREGRPPDFAHRGGLERDLFLIERDDPRRALEEIVSLVCERLPAHYGVDPLEDVQVFAPVYRGALGITAINARLREVLNPGGRAVLGGRLRLGDKLMLSGRNLHELGLMNGTVLRLLEHREDDECLTVEADGAIIQLPEDEAGRLQLAYACSVHKGQGIELPVAVVVAHPAAGAYFLSREMLYTAMTRARRATIVVGRADVVTRAAGAPDTGRRHSRLGARLPGGAGAQRHPRRQRSSAATTSIESAAKPSRTGAAAPRCTSKKSP
jgi:exodeoxyribonuclease V alpha subunit